MTARHAETASVTPLLSLSAAVFDTETTGLDVRKDRVVQIGAVRIDKGRLDETSIFDTYVDPKMPIPEASTKIHGITDNDVDGADIFPAAYGRFTVWADRSILLGYSIGFDLTILKGEAERAGMTWRAPRCLDVRHLVQLLAPPLPDQALDTVASWLGIEVDGRHNAVADALITARVFLSLVPRLRDAGIRTLAETEAACMRLSGQRSEEAQAGWLDVVQSERIGADSITSVSRVDSFPYRHRIAEIMSAPPVSVSSALSVRDVLSVLMREKISSVFVEPDPQHEGHGIITEQDLLRIVDADPERGLSRQAGDVATRPLITVPENEYAYRAIARMNMNKLRHLGVVDDKKQLIGAVTARDLLGQRAREAIALSDEIENATSPEELGLIWAKLSMIARSLLLEEVGPRTIAGIISNELRALTRQACRIAEREMLDAGEGKPPVAYAMLVLGSGGRGESLLAMDQDNAIIYQEGEAGGPADKWLEALGRRVSDILNAAGVIYCKGGIMAANAEWRMSLDAWRQTIAQWISRSRPQDILNSDIFFDSTPVHGDRKLGHLIRQEALEVAARSRNFLQLLSQNASDVDVPLGWFGRFRLTNGRVDLKMGGIMPIFSAARVLALRHGIETRSTAMRLEKARELMPDDDRVIKNLIDAHRTILGAILEQQLRDIDRGIPLSNSVAPKELTSSQFDHLKWSVEQVGNVRSFLGNPMVLG